MPKSLTDQQIMKQAERMSQAEMGRTQVKPPSVFHPEMTIEDAYLIQNAWIEQKISGGRKIVGHKVGLTSKVMQAAMSIDEPDFGILLDDMVFEHGAHIKTDEFLDPRIEVEIAFQLKEDLVASDLTIQKVIDASEYIVPALELIAARSFRIDPDTKYKRTVKDSISDNAANAGIILGDKHISKDVALEWVGAILKRNGVIEESGIAGAVLNHPANGVIWLAKKYASIGRILKAGQIILAGSFTRPVIVKPGDKIEADFNEFGTVQCTFI